MRRKTIINWSDAHARLKEAIENRVTDPQMVGATEKGWSYVTFCSSRAEPAHFLYDIDRIKTIARDNGFYLPGEIVRQHNKVLVIAHSRDHEPSQQLFGLWRFLMEFEKRFDSTDKFPHHDFFGKFGGNFDRSEKG
ncbi:MAG TPA: hypothetical protein PKG82_09950, partial [Myxococcota bacterium]|nr:hypothetical protein [Myxococcota bacterium]